jgi:hypothetical protein
VKTILGAESLNMADEEKPLDLRDRLAMEILNGLLSNSKSSVASYVEREDGITSTNPAWTENSSQHVERIIRACYKAADIMRKVRLTVFD